VPCPQQLSLDTLFSLVLCLFLLLWSIAVVASFLCAALALLPECRSTASPPRFSTHAGQSVAPFEPTPQFINLLSRQNAPTPSPQSLSNPPSQSSPLHPTHRSRWKAEWPLAGFRLSGQRVFWNMHRRPSCITCRSPVYSEYISSYILPTPATPLRSHADWKKRNPLPSYHTYHLFSSLGGNKVLYVALRACFFQRRGWNQDFWMEPV
jgi:hypothetical protein